MKPLKDIVPSLLMPLLYINLAGMAAGAVWLIMMAQWQVIWIGVVMIIFSPYIIPLLMVPAGILSYFMMLYQHEKRPKKERLMFVLSLAYVLLFVTLWCTGIFEYVTKSVHVAARNPALLWAATAAMAPLLLWSSRDRKNIFIMTMVETAQIALLILCAVLLWGIVPTFWGTFSIVGGILVSTAIIEGICENRLVKKSGEAPR